MQEYNSAGVATSFSFSIGTNNDDGLTWSNITRTFFATGGGSDEITAYNVNGAEIGLNFTSPDGGSNLPDGLASNDTSVFVLGRGIQTVFEFGRLQLPINITLSNLTNARHNLTIYGNDSTGRMGQTTYVMESP